MFKRVAQGLLVFSLVLTSTSSTLFHPTDHTPVAVVNELTSRLSSHPPRLQDPRLALPTPQSVETIKKVAKILIMLGEQVIPGLISKTPPSAVDTSTSAEIPNDPVTNE